MLQRGPESQLILVPEHARNYHRCACSQKSTRAGAAGKEVESLDTPFSSR